MGRTVVADDTIQTYVSSLLSGGQWYLGLIIGQVAAQRDYAVHIVRTPEPLEDQASDDDESEETEKSKKRRRRSQSKPASLDLMNEQWAATHAKQVTTMLPGGLQVIGIFALAPPQMIQSSQTKLRQSAFRPADWKYQGLPENWNQLKTDVAMDIPVDLPKKFQSSSVLKQIQYCVNPFCTRLYNSLTLIEGQIRVKNELLDQSTEKKVKGRDRGQLTQHSYRCNLLVKLCSKETRTVEDPISEEKIGRIAIKGKIHTEAYVTSKSTVEEAEKALKTDVVRSLISRCDLLCADIQVVEEDTARQEIYNTPMRVFFKLPGSHIRFCDYMFTDEKVQEVKERIKELLDISLEEQDLDLNSERNATEDDCSVLTKETPEGSEVGEYTEDSGKGVKYFIGLGGALAFLAAGLCYILTQES